MAEKNKKIDSSIMLAANARAVDQIDLFNSVAISQWVIDRNTVNYQKDDSHTLSMYMSGGHTSYRADLAGRKGAPGTLCLMPQGHNSDWHINEKINFVHLYFTDAMLKQFAASHFGSDVRLVELQDLTYQQDPELQRLLAAYYGSSRNPNTISPMAAEQILYAILERLLSRYNSIELKTVALQGGLSSFHMKQTRSTITEQLHEKLTIAYLAELVGLSSFHFAKMFKMSFGEAPAQYITRQRVECVKQLLKTSQPLAEVSVMTGFSQQSHMTHNFKKLMGLTPVAFRRDSLSLLASTC